MFIYYYYVEIYKESGFLILYV